MLIGNILMVGIKSMTGKTRWLGHSLMIDHFIRNRKVLYKLVNINSSVKKTLTPETVDFIVDSKDSNWTQLTKLSEFFRSLSEAIVRSQKDGTCLSEAMELIRKLEFDLEKFLESFNFADDAEKETVK